MTGETFRVFGQSFIRAPLPWLGMIMLAVGSDYIDLIHTAPGGAFSDLQVVSLIVRFAGVFWLAAVLLRLLANQPEAPWALDSGIVFFLVWQIVIFVLEGLVGFFLSIAKNISAEAISVPVDPYILTLIFIGLAVPMVDLLLLRIAPWIVARTAHVAFVTFGTAWRGMRGNWSVAAKTYLTLVLPLFAVHYALTAWIPGAHLTQQTRLQMTMFDGVDSITMLVMSICVQLVLFKRVKPQA